MTARVLYGYYPDLKANMAETLLPKAISTDHALRPWGRDAWGEHTPRPDDLGAAAEEEAKAWIAKREEAVARMRSGGPQVLPRDEEETLDLTLTLPLPLPLPLTLALALPHPYPHP